MPAEGVAWADAELSEHEIADALVGGVAELDWGTSEEKANDLDVLSRLVWEAGLADFELLGLGPVLVELQSLLERLSGDSPRGEAISAFRTCAARLPGTPAPRRRTPASP